MVIPPIKAPDFTYLSLKAENSPSGSLLNNVIASDTVVQGRTWLCVMEQLRWIGFNWSLWDVWSYFCLSSLLASWPHSLMAWPSAQHSSSNTLSSLLFLRLSTSPSQYDSNFAYHGHKRMDISVSSLSELWFTRSFGSQGAQTSANNVVPQRCH